jgi:hypothetical protein
MLQAHDSAQTIPPSVRARLQEHCPLIAFSGPVLGERLEWNRRTLLLNTEPKSSRSPDIPLLLDVPADIPVCAGPLFREPPSVAG